MKNLAFLIRQFTIKTRMRGAIAMVLGLLGLIALVVVWGGQRVMALNTVFTIHTMHELRTVGMVRDQLTQMRVLEREIMIHHNDLATSAGHYKRWQEALAGARTNLNAMLQGEEDEDNAIAKNVLVSLTSYEQQSLPVLNNPKRDEYESARSMALLLAPAQKNMASVQTDLERIATIVDAEAIKTRDELQQAMQLSVIALACALLMAALVVTPLTLLNSSSITRPIQRAVDLAQAIAGGDLTQRVNVRGKDEVSALLLALQRMQDSLRQLVGQVHDSSQSIRTASVEVASGNMDLSHRTEQAAKALQQTSGSMEDLTGTVQSSARSAREASELAANAASVAQRGGEVVSQVVATMEDINTSSKKISDIIGTIDGIAFQTNILALNAAVEAARAGEQGRGFAVVAGEVRSLAQRSAGAAQEIKALIGTSVERVDNGSRLVADAGQTMIEIVASVQRVVQIIDAMAGAADDQSSGIGKINSAVSELDHMTQQNAALVEQSAAAADSLKQQATRLSEVVATFRLHAAGAAAAAA